MGAEVTWTETSVTVKGPPRNSSGRGHLRPVDVNMNKMPDVAMTLAVVALYADGPTAIRDGIILQYIYFCYYSLAPTVKDTDFCDKNKGFVLEFATNLLS